MNVHCSILYTRHLRFYVTKKTGSKHNVFAKNCELSKTPSESPTVPCDAASRMRVCGGWFVNVARKAPNFRSFTPIGRRNSVLAKLRLSSDVSRVEQASMTEGTSPSSCDGTENLTRDRKPRA